VSDAIPLQKLLQRRGVGTKRTVQQLIQSGLVWVDGNAITRFAEPVTPGQAVVVDGEPLVWEITPVVFLMNKPKKHLTQLDGMNERPGLGQYLPEDSPKVFPVGRLDYNSEGALLLTNDGLLARRILHPDWSVSKRYGLKIRGHLQEDDPGLQRMRDGMTVEEQSYLPATVQIVAYRTRATWVEVTIREGKNRQLRRMCAANRHQIVKLRRLSIGPILLGDLNPRCVRPLSESEMVALYQTVQLPFTTA